MREGPEGWSRQPHWLLLLYILPDPGRFLMKWFEMRTWVAQQMPSSVVGPEPSVQPRMRTGRWDPVDVGHGHPPGEVSQGSHPRAQGRWWLNEDLPRSLATRGGPCTCQHGSAQDSTPTALGSKPAPRLRPRPQAVIPVPGCDPAPGCDVIKSEVSLCPDLQQTNFRATLVQGL